MKIEIEKVDERHFVVRCVNPMAPPFKATEVQTSLREALDTANSMFAFPGPVDPAGQ